VELSTIGNARESLTTVDVSLEVGDDVLEATIRPLGMSTETHVALIEAQSSGVEEGDPEAMVRLLELLPRALSELVVDWNLKDGRRKIKPTEEELRKLPIGVLRELMSLIQEAAQDPKETSGS
jgi:hypothetical protein